MEEQNHENDFDDDAVDLRIKLGPAARHDTTPYAPRTHSELRRRPLPATRTRLPVYRVAEDKHGPAIQLSEPLQLSLVRILGAPVGPVPAAWKVPTWCVSCLPECERNVP